MELLFARHGETDWNLQKRIQSSADTDLNENGLLQAGQLAQQLKTNRIRPERIYTSRQKRARQTAETVADQLGVECIVQDGLEEISFGLWEGLTWVQVEEQFPEEFAGWYKNRRYEKTPEGESYQDLLDRLLPALHAVIKKEEALAAAGSHSGTILLVTHSAVIMSLMACLNNTPFSQMAARYKLKNTAVVHISSEKILAVSPGEGRADGLAGM